MAKRKTKKKKATAEEVLGKDGKEKTSKKSDTQSKKSSKKKKKSTNPDMKWYVVSTQTQHENSAAKSVKQRVAATETDELIEDVLVPVQKKIVVKDGKQEIKEERIFPGYILIHMILNEKTWELITNADGIRGFVRTDKYPRPLPENEVKAIMKYMEIEQPAYQASFSVGEAVKIIDGAFADFIGSVQSIDDQKGKAKVLISFLGREAPVELDFSQIEKL